MLLSNSRKKLLDHINKKLLDQHVGTGESSIEKTEIGRARVSLISGNELFCSAQSFECLFAIADLSENLCHYVEQVHRVGCFDGEDCLMIALDIPETDKRDGSIIQHILGGHSKPSNTYSWLSLRAALGLIPDRLFHLLGAGIQLVNWRIMHQYCGRCGSANQLHCHDRAMHCTKCQAIYFPRISPCVIGVVKKGQQILLAHNVNYKARRFSALAGFIEPGESAEEAFSREVMEEVGIEIKNLRYIESQPWPFPGQLMLGFFAEHAAGDIVVDEVEIDEASWFDIDELPSLPPQGTISRSLIDGMIQELSMPSRSDN